jgi:hypothetical protein
MIGMTVNHAYTIKKGAIPTAMRPKKDKNPILMKRNRSNPTMKMEKAMCIRQ